MAESIYDKLIQALKQAESHNSNVMVKPEVILWPDPDRQWTEIIGVLQAEMPQLLIFGPYDSTKKQGPAIWIKCMVAKELPDADWNDEVIPIIYLPGVAKSDLRNVENAIFNLQPLLEYQYTGTLFIQENGKEWSIQAFVENSNSGLGSKIAKDNATKEALKKALPTIFQDKDALANKSIIDADFLNKKLFPNIIPSILKWMCEGDVFLERMDSGKKDVFINLCKSQYDFYPDHKNIVSIAEKLGSQKNSWKQVWDLYTAAPHKYPEIEELLRMAKPEDLGTGIFSIPAESWPQVNEEKEEYLSLSIKKISKYDAPKALKVLQDLEIEHKERRSWVWYELGESPLVDALQYLVRMAEMSTETYSSSSIDSIKDYYTNRGYLIDQNMRKALSVVKTEEDKNIVKSVITLFYKPWLEKITNTFQKLVENDSTVFTAQNATEETEAYVLFVDAFRYELAAEFCDRLEKSKWKVELNSKWSAIPSLTPTAKSNVSPIAPIVSVKSDCNEFRPQLLNGKNLQTQTFRAALNEKGFDYVNSSVDIKEEGKYWHEIGDIDSKGHQEQAGIVKRVEELFEKVEEALDVAFSKGVKRVKIVTDHGWLLLPGGLPKTSLNVGLTETRWGRCALIKEGAKTDLLHLPWRWNPSVFIAYSPGISFFEANQEYAHGGISVHECLVPTLIVENPNKLKVRAEIKNVKWVNLRCVVETSGAPDGYKIDIRTKFNDYKSSILETKDSVIKDNKVTLFSKDSYEYQSASVVLLDNNGTIINKVATIVSGD